MNSFTFYNDTKLFFGKEKAHNFFSEIEHYGKNVLFIYSKHSANINGAYAFFAEKLESFNLNFFEFTSVEKNPDIETVKTIGKICREKNIDSILAVGGGSIMDCAKAVSASAYKAGEEWEVIEGKRKIDEIIPVFTVPTTIASGSEMNSGGLINNRKLKKKINFGHPFLQPKAAFINPEFTYTLDKHRTARGAADIITHILEGFYFGRNNKLKVVDRIMEQMVISVIENTKIAMQKPDDYEARANLMWVASHVLSGLLDTGAGYPPLVHIMEHEISARFEIEHGYGIGVLFPKWLEKVVDEDTAEIVACLGIKIFNIHNRGSMLECAYETVEKIKELFYDEFGLDDKFYNVKISQCDIKEMVEQVYQASAGKCIKKLSVDDIEDIYGKSTDYILKNPIYAVISWGREAKKVVKDLKTKINIDYVIEKDYVNWGIDEEYGVECISFDKGTELFDRGDIDYFIIPCLKKGIVLSSMYVPLIECGVSDDDILYVPHDLIYGKEKITADKIIRFIDRDELDRLEFHINDNCNLKCANCSMFAGLVDCDKAVTDYDKSVQSLKNIKKIYRHISEIDIIGGEPFLNPNLEKYCYILRELYPKAYIFIVTNGLFLEKINMSTIEAIKENNIILSITYYPGYCNNMVSVMQLCNREKIRYEILRKRVNFLKLYDLSGENDVQEAYDVCKRKFSIIAMRENKLAVCYAPFAFPYADKKFNISYKEEGVLDLFDETLTNEKIVKSFMKPMDCCRFCHTDFAKWQQIENDVDRSENWSIK